MTANPQSSLVRSFLIGSLALIIAGLAVSPLACAQDSGALLRDGKEQLQRKDFKAAEESFSAAIKAAPKSAEGYRLRGETRFAKSEYKAAIADYTRAVELDPQQASAFGARAVAKFRLKDYKGCNQDASSAIKLEPDNVNYYWTRGVARFELGDTRASLADNDQIIRLQPTAQAYFNRGMVREITGDAKGAIADFQKHLELAPASQDTAEARRRMEKLSRTVKREPAASVSSDRASAVAENWYSPPSRAFRFPIPPEAKVYEQADEWMDAIVWPDLRLAIFSRRDALAGDLQKSFLSTAWPEAPGRTATMLSAPAAAMVTRFDAQESTMYWHLCFVRNKRSYFITVGAPSKAPISSLPVEALRLLSQVPNLL